MGPGVPGALPSTPHAYLPLLVRPRTRCRGVSPDGDPMGLVVIPPAGLVETAIKQYNTCQCTIYTICYSPLKEWAQC